MKRLDIGREATHLDGVPYIKEFDEDGKPVHWTVRTLLIDTIQDVAMLAMGDSVIVWRIGLRLVDHKKPTIDLEDADFSKLEAAYARPQALLAKENWVKANLGLAFEAVEDIDLDTKKPKK